MNLLKAVQIPINHFLQKIFFWSLFFGNKSEPNIKFYRNYLNEIEKFSSKNNLKDNIFQFGINLEKKRKI